MRLLLRYVRSRARLKIVFCSCDGKCDLFILLYRRLNTYELRSTRIKRLRESATASDRTLRTTTIGRYNNKNVTDNLISG